MSKLILIFILLLSNIILAQRKFNSFSLETALGMHVPISPNQNINRGDYIGFKHLDIGARYMINEQLGVKFSYAYNRFENRLDKKFGNTYHRIGVEGVVNFSKTLNFSSEFIKTNALLIHSGIGVSYAYPDVLKKYKKTGFFSFGLTPNQNFDKMYEQIGNIIIGCTYLYKLSDSFALSADSTYIANYMHQYNYNGELLYKEYKKVIGGFMNFSIGIQFYIGKHRDHSDWYLKNTKSVKKKQL